MSGQFKSLSMNGASVSLLDEYVEVRLNVTDLNNVTSMNDTTQNTIKGLIDSDYINGKADDKANSANPELSGSVTLSHGDGILDANITSTNAKLIGFDHVLPSSAASAPWTVNSIQNMNQKLEIGSNHPSSTKKVPWKDIEMNYTDSFAIRRVFDQFDQEEGSTATPVLIDQGGLVIVNNLRVNTTPSNNLDAVNKGYVDNAISGLVDDEVELNTLKKLALAVGDKAPKSNTVTLDGDDDQTITGSKVLSKVIKYSNSVSVDLIGGNANNLIDLKYAEAKFISKDATELPTSITTAPHLTSVGALASLEVNGLASLGSVTVGGSSLSEVIQATFNNNEAVATNFAVTPTLSDSITIADIDTNNLVSRKFTDASYITNITDSTIDYVKSFSNIPHLLPEDVENPGNFNSARFYSDSMFITRAYLFHAVHNSTNLGAISLEEDPNANESGGSINRAVFARALRVKDLRSDGRVVSGGKLISHGHAFLEAGLDVMGVLNVHDGTGYRQLKHNDDHGTHTGDTLFDMIRIKAADETVDETSTSLSMYVNNVDKYAYIVGNSAEDTLTVKDFPGGIEMLNDTSVTGNLDVSGNITLGTQHGTSETRINGSMLIDLDRGLDLVDDHPQFRIHADDGEVPPTPNGEGELESDWTKARVILDKGPETKNTMLDIGNVARQWYYLNQYAYAQARTHIKGVMKFSVSEDTTEVMNDLTVRGTLTLDGGSEDTIKTLVNESGSLKWGDVAIPTIDWTAENAGTIHASNYTSTAYDDSDIRQLINEKEDLLNADESYELGELTVAGDTTLGVAGDTPVQTTTVNGILRINGHIGKLSDALPGIEFVSEDSETSNEYGHVKLQPITTTTNTQKLLIGDSFDRTFSHIESYANTQRIKYGSDGGFLNISSMDSTVGNVLSCSTSGTTTIYKDLKLGGNDDTLSNDNGTLKWNGVEILTATLPTFCVWAEEYTDLHSSVGDAGKSEWSFGNGSTNYPLARGLVIGVPSCRVISLTLDVGLADDVTDTSWVALTKNGDTTSANVAVPAGTFSKYQPISTDPGIVFEGGDRVNFKTLMGGGSTQRGVVCAWFERLT